MALKPADFHHFRVPKSGNHTCMLLGSWETQVGARLELCLPPFQALMLPFPSAGGASFTAHFCPVGGDFLPWFSHQDLPTQQFMPVTPSHCYAASLLLFLLFLFLLLLHRSLCNKLVAATAVSCMENSRRKVSGVFLTYFPAI